jgi:hypothetical protein
MRGQNDPSSSQSHPLLVSPLVSLPAWTHGWGSRSTQGWLTGVVEVGASMQHCWGRGVKVGASRLVDGEQGGGRQCGVVKVGASMRCCQGRGVKVGVSRWGHRQ